MKDLKLPWPMMRSTTFFTSTSEWAQGPWQESEQGSLLAPGPRRTCQQLYGEKIVQQERTMISTYHQNQHPNSCWDQHHGRRSQTSLNEFYATYGSECRGTNVISNVSKQVIFNSIQSCYIECIKLLKAILKDNSSSDFTISTEHLMQICFMFLTTALSYFCNSNSIIIV